MNKRVVRLVKHLLPSSLVNWIKGIPAYELYGMKHSPLGAPFAKVRFPPGTKEMTRECSAFRPRGRTAIFAMFSDDGRISDADVYYLKGLLKVVDNVVVIGDCPIFPTEVAKIEPFVRHYEFVRHGEYDFGSYKRGWRYARARLDLGEGGEVVFCNNSCYGPVVPFEIMFEKMCGFQCDFWGVCESSFYKRHVQSYFIVFRTKVLRSDFLDVFLSHVRREQSVMDVILKYEIGLTQGLVRRGFVGGAFIKQRARVPRGENPTLHPISLCEQGCPLVKSKALRDEECNQDGIQKTLEFLRIKNPELYEYVKKGDADV